MPMTIGQFLVIIAARRRSALIVFFCVLSLAVVASLLMPRRYTASAEVMLDVRSPDRASDSQGGSGLVAGMLAPGYMSTQVQVVTSERVARRAIQTLGLQSSAELNDEWMDQAGGKGDFEAWLSERLQKRLDVAASRDSNVIDISYTAADPVQAAATANAFMQAYIDTSLELKVEPARAYNSFFDERAKRLRADVEAAQALLSSFQKANQIVVTTDRLNVENARLSDLASQLVVLQSNAAQNEGKRAQAGARLDQLPEVLGNPVVSQLAGSLASEQARLQELTARYGPKHPQLIEQRARLAEVKSKLEVATARASGSVNVNASVNQAQLASVQKLLGEQRAKVMKLQGLRDEAELLRRDVENAQTAYSAMQQRVIQTRVESENTGTNVYVLKRATEPSSASSPKLLRNMGAAVFLGALLALTTALVRELRDRRVRTASDVEIELGQTLLLTLPVAKLPPRTSGRKRERAITVRATMGALSPNTA
jgi:succinoglycan biosynthesis transport protein ExoP